MKKYWFTFLLFHLYLTPLIAQETLNDQLQEWSALIKGGEIQTIEGLFIFSYEDKSGVIDSSGNIVVPFKYDYIRGFYNGIAAVNMGGQLQQNGFEVIKGGKWGLVHSTGEKLTELKYDYIPGIGAGWFQQLISVEKNGKKGIINRQGEEITDLKYDNVNCNLIDEDEMCIVSYNDSIDNNPTNQPDRINYYRYERKGLVNEKGEITEVKYDQIYLPFNNGICKTSISKYFGEAYGLGSRFGLINEKGKEILPPIYESIADETNDEGIPIYFFDDYALVSKNQKYGYVNKKGKIVIPLQYDYASPFKNGKAKVTVESTEGETFMRDEFYINKKGKRINE